MAGALALAGLQPPPQSLPPPDARGGGAAGGGVEGGEAWTTELRAEQEAARASAPPVLRLLWALHMATAAAGVAEDAAAARLEREGAAEEQDAAAAGSEAPSTGASDEMRRLGEMVLCLVMPAGQLLQSQLLAAGDAAAQAGPLPEGLAAVFCRTVKVGLLPGSSRCVVVLLLHHRRIWLMPAQAAATAHPCPPAIACPAQGWAQHLLAASSGADDAPARLQAVLQLVLHLALAQPDPCEALGCAAARALMQSAAAAGLAQLHACTPMLLQALQHAAGRIGGAPEAELMTAISCSLAGPRQGAGTDVESARWGRRGRQATVVSVGALFAPRLRGHALPGR
jgi:hypothetical protein